WLATAEEEIISSCSIDRNRYSIIGFIVLTTWLFATGAWTYFFSTAVDNPWVYVPLGAFMGFVILCIDRALIKGINKRNRNRIAPYLFRAMLALTIGFFMAQPAILYLFDKEIQVQVSVDNETRKRTKRQQLDSLYGARKNELLKEQQRIRGEQAASLASVNRSMENFLKEADGTGGTGKVGIEKIARAKKAEYDKLDAEHRLLLTQQQPLLDSVQGALANLESGIRAEEERFSAQLNAGFLTRVEALQHLLDGNSALRYRYYLIVALLMLIELMPVIVKSLLPAGSYEEKASLREEMEKELAYNNIQREKELKKLYNSLSLESDTEVIREFFQNSMEERRDKLKELSGRFKNDKRETFDQMWEKIKFSILSKHEN
ncbi:MAG: DUF4407 domain-containing protein, partial [Chitinophagaceae bacterium]|nr:DUF4407 domain-containing protein [Chitinophagaceae bacterium]